MAFSYDPRYQPGQIPQFGSFGPPNMSAQIQAGISKLADPFIARLRELEVANQADALKKDTANIFTTTPSSTPASAPSPVGGAPSPAGAPSFAGGGSSRPMSMPTDPALAPAIVKHATAAGIDPADLATAISYETGGTFDPWKKGPTTKWGEHRGLIQWGEPQRAQYGVGADTPVDQQVAAAVKYLQDRGVKPGHGLLEIYSAINAGGVGSNYYGRSDRAAGGAPGTVAEKVANQMTGHRRNAERLLASAPQTSFAPPAAPAPTPQAQAAVGVPGPAMDAATGRTIPPNDPRLQTPEFDRVHGARQAQAQAPTQVASLDPRIGLGAKAARAYTSDARADLAPEIAEAARTGNPEILERAARERDKALGRPPLPAEGFPTPPPQATGPGGQPLPPAQQPAPPLPPGPPPNEQPAPPPPPPIPPVEPPPPPPGSIRAEIQPNVPADYVARQPQAALPRPVVAPSAPALAPQVVPAAATSQPPGPGAAGVPPQAPVRMAQAQQAPGQRVVAPVDPVAERFWRVQLQHAKTPDEVRAIGQQLLALRQGAEPTIHTAEGRVIEYDPTTRQARELAGSTKPPPTAEGPNGMRYQWSEERQRFDIPVGPAVPAGQEDMFRGNSVEGQGLNHLVRTGSLTRDQAASVAAGKQVTGADGVIYWIPPRDLAGGSAGGGIQSRPANAPASSPPGSVAPAAPASASAAPTPGATQLTPPKPEKPDNLSPEAASRISLGNTFLERVPDIRKKIDAGAIDTPIARAQLVGGYGEPGTIKRDMASGRDALLRGLTGAGMSVAEANEYVERYAPSIRDTRQTLKEKLDNLERELKAVREGVLSGRKITDPALRGRDTSSSGGKGFTTPGGTRFEEVR